MAHIITIGINKDKVEFNEKGWANLTLFVDEVTDQYGYNVSGTMAKSKEEKEAGVATRYVGNGKVVWVDDKIKFAKAERKEDGLNAAAQSMAGRETPVAESAADDLPF